MRRLALLVIAGLVLGVVGTISVKVHHSTSGLWDRLRAEEARFARISGFQPLSRQEQGTTLCFIGCNEPRVMSRFRVEATSFESARETVATAFTGVLGEAVADPPGGLIGIVYADLPRVGDDAYAVVGDINCEAGPCVVLVLFTSGIE